MGSDPAPTRSPSPLVNWLYCSDFTALILHERWTPITPLAPLILHKYELPYYPF